MQSRNANAIMIQDASLFRPNLNVHLLQILRNLKWRLGLCLDLINSDSLGVFPQCQTLNTVDIKYCKVSDDGRYTLGPCERECALVENLGVALLVDVLHCDDDLGLFGVGDEIHGTPDALDLSRKHEVGEICAMLATSHITNVGSDTYLRTD